MFSTHTRILVFGSIILLIVGGGVLGLFIFNPKKNDSFLTPTKPAVVVTSSKAAISSFADSEIDNIPDSTKDVLTRPTTNNFVFASLTPLFYFVQKVADGGIEVVDLAQAKKNKTNQLSKNDFVLINKAKGIITTDNIPNQWIKDFFVDPSKKLDLTSGSRNPFWLSFKPLHIKLLEIKDFLILKDVDNKVIYEKNYERLLLKLDGMEQKYKKKLANCSAKVIVENGSSFEDLASEFGFIYSSIDTPKLD